MSSEEREGSWSGGQPVVFFKFVRGSLSWRYTSAQTQQTLNEEPYNPEPIWRSAISQGSEQGRQSITVTLPSTVPVAENWRPYPSAEPITLTVLVQHLGETDALVEWVGRVVSPKFTGASLELSCEPTLTRNRRRGTQRVWQRGCGLALYSQGVGLCNVDKSLHATTASLSAVVGLSVTATEFASLSANRLAGGYVEWTRADGLVEFRSIREHNGNTLVLDYGAADLAAGLEVTAYAGCTHTYSDCATFNNTDNYGGNMNLPVEDPYSGQPVW